MLVSKLFPSGAAIGLLLTLIAAVPAADGAAQDKVGPPIVRSVQSGAWSAGATWEGGKVPVGNVRVVVREGHRVVYDIKATTPVRSVTISGILSFAADKDTQLNVGLIKIQAGDDPSEDGFDCEAHIAAPQPGKTLPALEVGTLTQPINAKHTALIRLVYFDGMDKESCPAIVCCGGRMDLHGAPLSRSWLKLGETAKAGATMIILAEPVTGWKIGDRVILPTTSRRDDELKNTPLTEERFIQAIDGANMTLDRPLAKEHLGTMDFRGEVANLSRNVIVESADPAGVRGHTMYHRHSSGSLSYSEFRHLGKEGVLGRYSLHYHEVGDTMRGSSVIGNSIWDSGNRWLTIHGTNYLIVRDNVGYLSTGHGFFFEDGTEVYNVLDRNLAVEAKGAKRLPKQILGFDGNEGAGFWWANSLNTFTRNVAAGCGGYGFRYEATASSTESLVLPVQQSDGSRSAVDIRTLPFVRFDDNEVHSTVGLYGVNLGEGVNRVGPDTKHPFVVRNLTIWNVHYGFRPQVPSLLVDGLKLNRTSYGVYHPNFDNHVYRNVSITNSHTEPFNRGHDDDDVQYGALTVDGLTFERSSCGYGGLIQISENNPTGNGVSHFRNVKVDNSRNGKQGLVNRGGGVRTERKTENGVPIYLHDWFGAGQHALVVSTHSPEFLADSSKFREEAMVTGDESRLAEVNEVSFPNLLDRVDDLPTTTVITLVQNLEGRLLVRGSTADNGTVKRVLVNGKAANATAPNFAEWEITLEISPDRGLKVEAFAEDAAGNVEKKPHVVMVK